MKITPPTELNLKENGSYLSTQGLLSVCLIVLIILNQLSAWWLFLAIPLCVNAIALERGGQLNAIYRKNR